MKAILAALLLAAAATPDITGTWTVRLNAGHVIPVPLVLKHDGSTLTGTIALPTQNFDTQVEVPLKGQLTDGAFTLSGTVEHAEKPTTVTLTGKIRDDGTLEGEADVTGHAHIPWTAERLKERKPQQ